MMVHDPRLWNFLLIFACFITINLFACPKLEIQPNGLLKVRPNILFSLAHRKLYHLTIYMFFFFILAGLYSS